jgi:hypothetical protein
MGLFTVQSAWRHAGPLALPINYRKYAAESSDSLRMSSWHSPHTAEAGGARDHLLTLFGFDRWLG